MVADGLTVAVVLAAVAGGALGAAIGALPALSLAGLAVIAGEAADALARTLGQETLSNPRVAEAVQLTELVGLGPALGPHAAFAGGVAAAAYAGRRGESDPSFPYHPAKDVRTPLGSTADVLLAGGIFGLIGVLVANLALGLGLPVDPAALAVVLSAFGHRLAFGYSLFGRFEASVLDMTPYERGATRGGLATGGESEDAPATDRPLVEPWQPHHYEWLDVGLLGLVVGLVAGFVGIETGSAFLAFGIALASLLFLALGLDRFPVTHHMALPGSIAALGVGAEPAALAVAVAGVFGLLGGLLGELAQRGLYAHADTHLDPSFVSIFLTSVLLALLGTVGVLDPSAIPYPTL